MGTAHPFGIVREKGGFWYTSFFSRCTCTPTSHYPLRTLHACTVGMNRNGETHVWFSVCLGFAGVSALSLLRTWCVTCASPCVHTITGASPRVPFCVFACLRARPASGEWLP